MPICNNKYNLVLSDYKQGLEAFINQPQTLTLTSPVTSVLFVIASFMYNEWSIIICYSNIMCSELNFAVDL